MAVFDGHLNILRSLVNVYDTFFNFLSTSPMSIAPEKSWSVRGASHQPAFMSGCLTISQTFCLPHLPRTRGVPALYALLRLE